MVVLIVASYCGIKAINNDKKWWFVLFGVSSAILINLRIVGAIYPVIFSVFYLIERKNQLKKSFVNIIITALVTMIVLYSIWPFLWHNPIENFLQVIKNMSAFRWENDKNFLFGEYISARNLVWYYLPVWIGITTPVIILILFLVGTVFVYKNKYVILFSIGLFIPILAAILNKSVLYDGWRHFYFIYPLMVVISVNGLTILLQRFSKKYLTIIVAAALVPTLYFSIKNHPHQQVYFNELVPKKENYLLRNFERDYWGASFYQGLQKLATVSKKDTIIFHSNIRVGYMNTLMFDPIEKPYFKYVSTLDSADFFITNYRWHPQEYSFENKLFDISIQNSPIITAWKLN
jgi:hypothetical protein